MDKIQKLVADEVCPARILTPGGLTPEEHKNGCPLSGKDGGI
jgi:hypothetical protein